MSSKTKIVVLHMKEVIYTVVFVILGILLILLLTFMFLPNGKKHTSQKQEYMPGVYTSTDHFKQHSAGSRSCRGQLPYQLHPLQQS